MAFDENMTVGEYLDEVFEKQNFNPDLNFKLIFNGRILADRDKTLKELGVTKISELTLMYKEIKNKKRTVFKKKNNRK